MPPFPYAPRAKRKIQGSDNSISTYHQNEMLTARILCHQILEFMIFLGINGFFRNV